jgi:hypothetical protein
MTVPAPLAWLCRVVLLDLLDMNASFQQLLHKIVILTGLLYYINPFGYFFYNVYLIVDVTPFHVAQGVSMAGYTVMVILWTVLYIHAKCNAGKDISSTIVNVWCYGTLIGMAGVTLGSTYRSEIPILSLVIEGCLVRMPGWKIYVGLYGILFAIAAYNTTAREYPDTYTALSIGTPVPDGPVLALITSLSNIVVAAVPVISCIITSTQQSELLAVADGAAVLASEVSNHLKNYDTEAVTEAVEAYREGAHVDPDLVVNYEAIVCNLDLYRAHLPNWMLKQSVAGSESASARSRSTTMSLDENASVVQSPARLSIGSFNPKPVVDTIGCGAMSLSSTVAFSIVEYRITDVDNRTERGAACSRFVDHVHACADASRGALHSFAGDAVQLSWNAATKVPQPEVKALRFLCALRDALADEAGVTAAGAVMSGKAITQFAGTGRVQALSIQLPWRAKLHVLFAFAVQHRAYVADSETTRNALDFVDSREVGVLHVPHGGGTVTVSDVVSEKKEAVDSEWMYVVDKAVEDIATRAVALCVKSAFAEALEALEAAPQPLPPLVQQLRDRAEQAVLTGQFSSKVCGCE